MSGLFNVGIEEDTLNVSASKIGVEDLLDAAGMMEIEADAAEIEELTSAVDKGMESAELLEEVISLQEAALESDNEITAETVRAIHMAHDALGVSLGLQRGTLISAGMESEDPKEALAAGLEEDKNVLERIWDTIKKVIARAVQFFQDMITKIMMKFKNVEKAHDAIVEKAKELKKSGYEDNSDWKSESLNGIATNLLGIFKHNNIKTMNESAFRKVADEIASVFDPGLIDDAEQVKKETIKATADIDKDQAPAAIQKLVEVLASIASAGDKEVAAYGPKTAKFVAVKKKAKEFFSKDELEFFSIEEDTEILLDYKLEIASIKDAKKEAENLKPAALSVDFMASGPMTKAIKGYETIKKEASEVTKSANTSMKEMERVVKSGVADLAKEKKEGWYARVMMQRKLTKLFSASSNLSIKVSQRTALDAFRTMLAALNWCEKSLGAYKAKSGS